ncbi:galactokinase [Pontibacter liquoris]|uniref:galactokinase n=1 Tax=Pontibacter liquoris TaxID=2905677 RepID=UPI001FA6BEDD|nr:galactokinase [Pontibacter liquoris]
MIDDIQAKFRELYQQEPLLVRSPGRVNLIGEHTDYNDGFVLPAAINKEIFFAIAPNNTNQVRMYAFDLQESATFDVNHIQRSKTSWHNYLLGVIAQFQKGKYKVPGFDVVFGGNVPIGAGLSSSAAVECGLAFGLNHLFDFGLEKLSLVKMAQLAEHEYAGVMSGIMDQFASMFGKKNHAIKLDCRSLDYEYMDIDMQDYRIVLCDTRIKHSLAATEYNTRRKECEAGVALLRKHYPEITSLRDVTLPMLEQHQAEFDPVVYRRCTYVVQENNRVLVACQHLEEGDMQAFGQQMYVSHEGLQHDYEVSCPELDFLVDQTRPLKTVAGARMMGGGFGGCTINLVETAAVDAFTKQMADAYQKQFGVTLQLYIASIVDGSSLVDC